ncbi:MAG TPA: arylsulfatase [Lacipirellulaceae bacterium]|nr:arylsulfatase [Lacipirellulaceae bacterium]
MLKIFGRSNRPRRFMSIGRLRCALGVCLGVALGCSAIARPNRLPNIVLIVADDLGYGDLGSYGQQVIQTPRLDRMAAEGMRFTQFYAGTTVCAPSRCVLMTGLHTGHARVRGNGSDRVETLKANDVTVAEVLKLAGYATAICGKWGLGSDLPGNEGLPNDHGFDFFYGYLSQVHAHNYYPTFLWRNKERVPLENVVRRVGRSLGGIATKKVQYSADLIRHQAIDFVKQHRNGPFFLYWPTTLPHGNSELNATGGNGYEVPDFGIYADRSWPERDKGKAAMITRMDADCGQLFDTLHNLGIEDNTLVLFASDNGPQPDRFVPGDRFHRSGPLRGMKRDMYEGGIRVPLIARWPGKISAGDTSDWVGYFGDVFATLGALTRQPVPKGLDSISMLPTLMGNHAKQQQHDYLYWEFYEGGTKQAVRWHDWKAVRMPMITGNTELYNLAIDPGETNDVAADHPDIVRRLEQMMQQAHKPNPVWQAPTEKIAQKRQLRSGHAGGSQATSHFEHAKSINR